MPRTFLSGADVVLVDRVASNCTVVLEHDRIIDILQGPHAAGSSDDSRFDVSGRIIVPGFVDVHVHGVLGVDVMDDAAAVRTVARQLPRFGVTAFCPTSVASSLERLQVFLDAVGQARTDPEPGAARVLPAHLESPFINPDYRGAQPLEWLSTYEKAVGRRKKPSGGFFGEKASRRLFPLPTVFSGPDVGILTMAPEIPGGMDLLLDARQAGIRVSLGHSGATYEEAMAAIDAGACHATHLFNRMPPMTHRHPGLVGAVLERDEVAAEIICDGFHVHPSVVRTTVAAKGASRVMAITDATAGAGLPYGASATLGGRRITVRETAQLDDGTLAGSVVTMDRVFAMLVTQAGQSLIDAAALCSTTPARELRLASQGTIAVGQMADLVVLSSSLKVEHTWIAGRKTAEPER